MPKRGNETQEERKLRKIRKLEEKLTKYKDALASSGGTPEVPSILEGSIAEQSEEQGGLEPEQENIDLQEEELIEVEEGSNEEEQLSQDILAALGEGGLNRDTYGEEIKPEINNIMFKVLTDGLDKSVHEDLIKTVKIPINAKLLDAPKLNREFSGLLITSITNRDNLLRDRQQDLGRGIALVSQAINNLTNKEFNKLDIIKTMSDSLRLLSNLHHQYTQVRRKMIAPYLDKALTQNLNENKRSEFLYSQLQESVKTSSAMKQTINILKPKNVSKNYQSARRPNQHVKTVTNNSNYKPGAYQSNPGQSYRPQHRNHPRPPQQPRAARRPISSYRGGRAKYP